MDNYTDEELLSAANKGLYSFLAQKLKTTTVTIQDCLDYQKVQIKGFIQSRKPHYWETLTKDEKSLVRQEIERLKDVLRQMAETTLLKVQKDNTIQKINANCTEALVKSFMEEHDITVKYIWMQKYRAKVAILLNYDKILILHIKYKNAAADLEHVPQTVADANRMIDLFGRDVKIF
ncbi:MAG: hypothetical protein MJZ16_06845 [Bacteroidales bacterium]|nr:hypothetical protein [Bacteroidales bacterium]